MKNIVQVKDNEVFTNTKILAEKLSGSPDQHRNIMKTVERLIKKGSISINEAMISSYSVNNRLHPMYELTESGYKKLMTVVNDSFNKTKSSRIYIMSDGDFIKIGITSNVDRRLKSVQTGNPREVKIIYSSQKIQNAQKIESKTHKHFKGNRLMGEWFNVSPMTAVDFIEKQIGKGV